MIQTQGGESRCRWVFTLFTAHPVSEIENVTLHGNKAIFSLNAGNIIYLVFLYPRVGCTVNTGRVSEVTVRRKGSNPTAVFVAQLLKMWTWVDLKVVSCLIG